MQILPAIDIINGKCVRLTKGDFDTEKVYSDNPLDMAIMFEKHGAEYLHIVDLDAAAQQGNNLKYIAEICKNTKLKIQMGGGIRNEDILKQVYDIGVERAIIGSLAVTNEDEVISWINKYGREKIVIGADVNNGFISINGWKTTTNISIEKFISNFMSIGADTFLCTDIFHDGTLNGIAIDLYKSLIYKFKDIKLISSGGVGSIEDVYSAKENSLYGIVIGKAIYEQKIILNELFKI